MLLLPETALLSDSDLGEIKEYVRKGGTLLSFGYGSLFDQEGRLKSDFALADLFGCEYTGTLAGYKRLALARIGTGGDAPAVPWGTGGKAHHRKGPGPMEYAGDSPAIVENTYGQGRVIYVSAEELAFGEGSALLGELTARLIGAPAFEIHGSRHYALLVNRKGDDLLCHLLNRDTAPAPYTQGRLLRQSDLPKLETPESVRLTIHTDQLGDIGSAELIPSGRVWMSRQKGSIELNFDAAPSVTTVRLSRPRL